MSEERGWSMDEVEDELLLEELRRIARRVDPVPYAVQEFATAAFGFREPEAELARLLHDSAVDAPAAAIRSDGGSRLLTFQTQGFSLELEVVTDNSVRRLVGQLVPPAPAQLTVVPRAGAGPPPVEADEHGVFVMRDVPAGWSRIRCLPQGGTRPARAVITDWVML